MTCSHGVHASEIEMSRIARKIAKREFPELWRELARPITLFDVHSPAHFLANGIGEFFVTRRARQGSNLRPPA